VKKNADNKVNDVILIITVFIGFLIFGFSENIKGPAIPRIQWDFSLNEMQIGLLLALNSLGYLLACSYTGWLSKKIGLKATSVLCFVTMAVAGVLIYLSPSYVLFSGSYFIMYLGNGMLEISLGILAAKIFTKNTGTMMNLSHFFYGLSSMAGPVLATWLMGVSFDGNILGWRGMYLIVLSLSLIPIIFVLAGRFPKDDQDESQETSFKQYVRNPIAWLIVLILSFGVTCEMAVGGWLVNFLEKSYNFSTSSAAGVLTWFFVCFTLARLLLGPVIDRMGYVKSLLMLSCFAGISIIAGVIIGRPAVFLLALAGFGVAPIYPTVMALLSKVFPRNINTAMSFTLTIMGIAIVIGNFLVGAITDIFINIFTSTLNAEAGIRLGYSAGYIFIGVCSLVCFVGSAVLYKKLKGQGKLI
jgi:fucose permease